MFLSTLLPLLLVAVVPPPPSLSLLIPPEGPEYPNYDLPSLQYLPHNTLASYHHQGLLPPEEGDEGDMNTRSGYLPVPKPSSSSSSCTVDDLARFLSVDDLDVLVGVVAKLEDVSVKEILFRLSLKHGLHLKEKEHPIKKPTRELQTGGIEVPQVTMTSPEGLQDLHFQDSSSSSSSSSRESFLHQHHPPPPPPPPPAPHSPSALWQHEPQEIYEPVANEVPAPAAASHPSHPPRALLVVVGEEGEEVVRSEVTLSPHMALLDALNQATASFALQYGPYAPNPLSVKVQPIISERCLGLQSIGSVRATSARPLHLSVTRTRPTEQIVWESVCLPRVSELMVRRGDVIVLAPR